MRSTQRLMASLALLLCATTVSGCAAQERTRLAFPSAELQAAIEPKPQPTAAILTSDQASEDYNAALEGWGDRVSAAGGRICRWFKRAGAKVPFECPPPVAGEPER